MASFITAGNATNGLQVSSDNTGILELRTGTGSGTTAVTFSTGQRATFPSTIAVGNATPSSSGAGITFPATQSASSDANTLDDYEEGLASVFISDGTTSLGPYNMFYTKIGRTVTVGFSFYNVNVSTLNTTGRLRITGMPFPEALEQTYCAPIFLNSSGRNYIATISSSVLSYYISSTAVDVSNLTRADLGSPSNISFFGSFTYQAA